MKRYLCVILAIFYLMLTPAQASAPTFHKNVVIKEIATPNKSRAFAKIELAKAGYSPAQYACLDQLWTHESNWRHNARNTITVYQGGKRLHAYGIAQVLGETSSDFRHQIAAGLKYIKHRYSTPCQAWFHWQRTAGRDLIGGWY